VSAEGMQLLMAHDWPGNVRELRNVLERAAVVATGNILEARDLGLAVSAPSADAALGSLEEVERRHIADVLRRTSGNVSQAARILDIDRATLYNKMKKYQFRRPDE
jgi:DNA-binding NtrC family response regulator